jgi:hypothetical protein
VSLPGLRDALRAHGGTISELVVDDDAAEDPGLHPTALAARGPRVAGRAGEYELLLEMIFEGSLLHYGAPRAVAVADPDLALLLGDQLYALGLSRLSDLGDLDAIAELADVISLLAQARANGDGALADAIWEAGAASIGWGPTPAHAAAKALARVSAGEAAAALRDSARRDPANPQ